MVDNRLLNALDGAAVLDGAPTRAQIDSVRQWTSILLQALDSDGMAHQSTDTLARLLWATLIWCDEVAWGDVTRSALTHEYFATERTRRLADWRQARTAAEMEAFGHIRATTLTALAAAEGVDANLEPVGESLTGQVAGDDTVPPLLDAMTYQQAFEAGLTGVPSAEAGHAALYPNPGPF